jgi:hypothetical protein
MKRNMAKKLSLHRETIGNLKLGLDLLREVHGGSQLNTQCLYCLSTKLKAE